MYLAFLVILALAGLYIFRQGRQLQKAQDSLHEQIEWRRAQQSHINFVEAENRRYEDTVRKFENSQAHLDPGFNWVLRDDPDPEVTVVSRLENESKKNK